MIRKATQEDIDLLIEMGIKFAEASPYKTYYTKDKLRTIADFSSREMIGFIAFIDEDKRGMLVGYGSEFLLGKVKVATEIAWWVNPEDRKTSVGKELLQAFEQWAKEQDCKLITMISIDDTLGSYYEKCGYKLTERTYMKEIN